MKILLVEDDEVLAAVLTQTLTTHHYAVDVVHDGEMGWTYGSTFEYDLIILDLVLPKTDGICLCQRLRSEGDTTPILLLTTESACTAKVSALNAGVDDYVVKPFDAAELIARIRALLRRSSSRPFPIMTWGDLLLNPSTGEVTYNSQPLTLTAKEYELLELLLQKSPYVLSSEEILDRLWSSDAFPAEATVRSHIRRLRNKLEKVGAPTNFITTVHGRGYYLGAIESESASETPPEQDPQTQYSEFLNQLWQMTQPKSLEQIEEVVQAIAALRSGTFTLEIQAQARHITHKLAGTLGTFGLTQAMQFARSLEQHFASQILLSAQQVEVLEPLCIALQQDIQQNSTLQLIQTQSTIVAVERSAIPRPRVMIVDDDRDYLRTLPALLQPWDFNITTLAEPQHFWTVLKSVMPDILVLDISMPEVNGLELCRSLRQDPSWQRLPILILSALGDSSTQNLAFTLGIDDYLCKPILGIDLSARIRNRLQRVQAWKV